MAIGKNVQDKLIRKTTGKGSITSNVSKAIPGEPSKSKEADTYGTIKMTFYVKTDLYAKLKNFAYQDKHTLTEAFNLVIEDGLRGKNTKNRG
jgi:hypothetical protein